MTCKVILKKRKIKRGRDKIKPPRKARVLGGKIANYFNDGILQVIPLEDSTLIRYILVAKTEINYDNFEIEYLAEQTASKVEKIPGENSSKKQESCYEISISSSDLQQDLDKLSAEIVKDINGWLKANS